MAWGCAGVVGLCYGGIQGGMRAVHVAGERRGEESMHVVEWRWGRFGGR